MHKDPKTSDFALGWDAATRDLDAHIVQLGDPGFQPPRNNFQRGYNQRIDAPQGPGVIGLALVVFLGLAMIGFATFVYHYITMPK